MLSSTIYAPASLVTVSATTFTLAEDSLAITLVDLSRGTTINIYNAFVAAQQAVLGFAQLPASAARTFIYAGNALNVPILPKFLSQGIGNSGVAQRIWFDSDVYKYCG